MLRSDVCTLSLGAFCLRVSGGGVALIVGMKQLFADEEERLTDDCMIFVVVVFFGRSFSVTLLLCFLFLSFASVFSPTIYFWMSSYIFLISQRQSIFHYRERFKEVLRRFSPLFSA